ncbi:unnamed protein product [Pleuronectes platessa]|uniref:Uncharacterized protein n=1 Tax=Pleuronectes platessa TaxID=8262 RepID=A0A9N7V9P6_PLEPL|nr:unnamed protein product [Pleuronectes platessa]
MPPSCHVAQPGDQKRKLNQKPPRYDRVGVGTRRRGSGGRESLEVSDRNTELHFQPGRPLTVEPHGESKAILHAGFEAEELGLVFPVFPVMWSNRRSVMKTLAAERRGPEVPPLKMRHAIGSRIYGHESCTVSGELTPGKSDGGSGSDTVRSGGVRSGDGS